MSDSREGGPVHDFIKKVVEHTTNAPDLSKFCPECGSEMMRLAVMWQCPKCGYEEKVGEKPLVDPYGIEETDREGSDEP